MNVAINKGRECIQKSIKSLSIICVLRSCFNNVTIESCLEEQRVCTVNSLHHFDTVDERFYDILACQLWKVLHRRIRLDGSQLFFDHVIGFISNDRKVQLLLEELRHLGALLIRKCARLFVQILSLEPKLLRLQRHSQYFVGEADIVVDLCLALFEAGT